MKTTKNSTFKLLLICLIFAVVIAGPPAAAARLKRVAVVPFKINAADDLSFLKDGIVDMLISRLSWEGKVAVLNRQETAKVLTTAQLPLNESKARKIGAELGVDYVLFGSLTVFGNSVSIDAKMVDVAGQNPPLAFFNQSQGMDEVIPKINLFATDINTTVFGRKTAQSPPPAASGPPESTSIYAHPERRLAGGMMEPGINTGSSSPFIINRQSGETAGFWKSRNLKIELKGLALGDVDGDGKTETILISSQKIFVYRSENHKFLKIKEISSERYQQFVAVDAADINKNGRAEIFVTCLNIGQNALESFVLEWSGQDFATVAKGQNWYYRVQADPELGPILLGQKRGITDLFIKGVYEIAWNQGGYVAQNRINLPGNKSVFGFARGDLMHNGSQMVLAFDEGDYLRLYTPSGGQEWKSEDRYGGSENFLALSVSADGSGRRLYLPHRIFVTDLDKDGKSEVVVIKNDSTTGHLFKGYRRYSGARFESLSWNGLGLAPNWHTRKISGYGSDYALGDFNNDGKIELVGAIVSKRGSAFEKAKSAVIAYDLATFTKQN